MFLGRTAGKCMSKTSKPNNTLGHNISFLRKLLQRNYQIILRGCRHKNIVTWINKSKCTGEKMLSTN